MSFARAEVAEPGQDSPVLADERQDSQGETKGPIMRRSGSFVASYPFDPDSPYRGPVDAIEERAVAIASNKTVLFLNRQCAETLQRSSLDPVGQPLSSWLEVDPTSLDSLLENKSPEARISASLRSPRGVVPVTVSAQAHLDREGRAFFCLTLADEMVPNARPPMDARPTQPVERSELDAIFSGLPFALFVVNRHGDVTCANAKADLLMRSVANLPELVENVCGAARGDALETQEKTLLLSSGGTAYFQMHASDISSPEDPGRALVVLQDITAARKVEEERLVDEQFREMFVGILGHDLRTPLNSILAAAAIAKQRAKSPAETKLSDIMLRSCRRMGRLVEDILDMTQGRIGGGIPLVAESADLLQVVATCIDEIEGAAPLGRFDVRSEGDTTGFWDVARLMQVMTNLLKNAMDYGDPVTRVRVQVDGRGDEVTVAVKNRGTPIAKELLPVIFDPFRRGGRPGKRQGIGLGLYIAERIAVAHGGRISVQSSAEDGTTFVVTLPRMAARLD